MTKEEVGGSNFAIKNEPTLEEQSVHASSQDSVISKNFGNIEKKIKFEGYDETSSQSESASQFMNDLDITRKRVDIAERILMYADNEDNPFKDTQGSEVIIPSQTQESVCEEGKALLDAIKQE